MEQRLFGNQIQPQAQPISSFVQPQQFRRANATQPSQLGSVSQIVQSQQSARGSVQGFNQMEQLTTSLAPFSKTLSKGLNKGFQLYATSNIETGYYQEAKNQAERARLQMQINQEKGGEEAAALQTQLEKMDPVGASLLREANPWKAIGRRRALAQQAAGQVATELQGDLAENASELSGIKPGSQVLGDRKMRLTQAVYKRFGLTGDELEANYYVTPEVNRQWDKYTQTQSKLYNAELLDSTIRLTGQEAARSVNDVVTNGVLTSNGVIAFGSDGWAQVAGLKISNDIDSSLDQLGGEDRIKAIEKIKQQLTYLAATGGPRYQQAIENIRWGRRVVDEQGNDILDKRPTWLESRPYDLADYTRKALETDNAIYNEEQQSLENKFEQDLEKATAGLIENSPEWYEAVRAVDEKYEQEGLRNRAQKLSSWISNEESIAAGVGVDMRGPVDAEDIELIEDYINNMTYEQLTNEDEMKVLDGMLTGYIERVVGAPNRVSEKQRLTKLINDRIAVINKTPTGAGTEINNYVKSDLLDPAIAALKPRTSALTGLTVVPQGQSRQTATNNGQRYKAFENTVRGLYQREYQNQLNVWRARPENQGINEPNLADKAQLIQDTATAVRGSAEFKTAKDIALGKLQANGTPKPPPTPQGNKNLSQGPIPAKAASTVTAAQASKYRTEPIMDGRWVRSEYTNYANTRKTSPQLNGLAQKAGVAPLRFLIEQINQYPLLDPQGTVRDALLKELNKNKKSSTPAVPVLSDMDDPDRAPGSWLADMVMPVTGVEIAQVAGIRPLPINRMVIQAGRRKNRAVQDGQLSGGPMMFTRRGARRFEYSPEEVQRLLRSDPQFKRSYERQIVGGESDDMTDKYGNLFQASDGSVYGRVFKPYVAGGQIQRNVIPKSEINKLTIERQKAAREAIENWDPIEASAREDFNRLRGGNRSIVNPGALPLADELIQTIGTPIAPPTSQMDRYGI